MLLQKENYLLHNDNKVFAAKRRQKKLATKSLAKLPAVLYKCIDLDTPPSSVLA
jgi:hypothetical protein